MSVSKVWHRSSVADDSWEQEAATVEPLEATMWHIEIGQNSAFVIDDILAFSTHLWQFLLQFFYVCIETM